MYPHVKETQFAIKGMMEASLPFDTNDIKELTETILIDDGKFYDPITEMDVRSYLLAVFEKGYMPGYYITTKYICDDVGPKIILEFAPENELGTLDLIIKPEDGVLAKCLIHPEYKELLKEICKKVNTTQDMFMRSILVKALDAIYDQLK